MSIFSTLNIKDSIRIKTFELHDHTFKVKIPLAGELDAINNRIIDVPKADIDARFGELSAKLLADGQIEGVEKTKNDLIIDGMSVRQISETGLRMERKVVEYFKLLVPENGSLEEINYEDINSEFPMQIQFEFLDKISEVIQPNYTSAKKN